jgi:hypothetical protein
MNRPRNPRPRRPSDRGDGKNFKDKAEADLIADLENRVRYFMSSDSQELVLEPMNSYKRRLVHQIAKPYNLDTDSRGEEPERHVCLIKSSESKLPEGVSGPRLWDFGSLTLPVNPGNDGLRMALKVDGSVEIWQQHQSHLVLAERVVTASQIRIRKGKIVQPGEPDW